MKELTIFGIKTSKDENGIEFLPMDRKTFPLEIRKRIRHYLPYCRKLSYRLYKTNDPIYPWTVKIKEAYGFNSIGKTPFEAVKNVREECKQYVFDSVDDNTVELFDKLNC